MNFRSKVVSPVCLVTLAISTLKIGMYAPNKVNVLMPNAVSDNVSHSTLTDTLSPLLRETFK